MQVKSFISDENGFLERSALQRTLFAQCDPFHGGKAFDCAEFGICVVTWAVGEGNTARWYRPAPKTRRTKPKMAVKVVVAEGVWGNFRYIWHFALSKTGLLYPVAYEEQEQGKGPWLTIAAYYSWRKIRQPSVREASRKEAIPSDTICREAERLFKLKSISKSRKPK